MTHSHIVPVAPVFGYVPSTGDARDHSPEGALVTCSGFLWSLHIVE